MEATTHEFSNFEVNENLLFAERLLC